MLFSDWPPQQISLETERLGPRRVEGLRREDEEWQKKAHAAVLSIQELTVKFFETTTRTQKGNKTKQTFSSQPASPLDLCPVGLRSCLSAGNAPRRNVCKFLFSFLWPLSCQSPSFPRKKHFNPPNVSAARRFSLVFFFLFLVLIETVSP